MASVQNALHGLLEEIAKELPTCCVGLVLNDVDQPETAIRLLPAPVNQPRLRHLLQGSKPALVRQRGLIDFLLPGAAVKAVALVPLPDASGGIAGMLGVGVPDGTPQASDMERWTACAQRVSQSLEDLLSGRREERRNAQLDLLNRLAKKDVWQMELDDFFDMAMGAICHKLGYYNVSLFLVKGERLVLEAHTGAYTGQVHKGHAQNLDEGMLGWVARNGEMLLANDITLEPNYVAVEGLETRAEICLPLVVDDAVAGVVNVESNQVGAFDRGDVVALTALTQQVAEVVQMKRQGEAFRRLQLELAERRGNGRLIGRSESMHRVYDLMEAVAPSDLSVLIRGETGTGKELVARSIHDKSPRRDKPFIAVNCAALPEALIESELFGHERGAFTGAERQRLGKLELADGGTLFLDEVAEIPSAMQAKLLRALETQRFTRVGGEREVEVDVRILAATHQPVEEDDGFRADLFYRLSGAQVHLPPLRQRPDDIALLAAHFLETAGDKAGKRLNGISPDALAALVAYAWPGNVRELQNAVERAVLLEKGDHLSQVQLGRPDRPDAGPPPPTGSSDGLTLKEVGDRARRRAEEEFLRGLLARTGGNISRAARQAGVDRRTLYNKMAAYAIERGDFVGRRNGEAT